jgi:hypothetical protein
MGGETAGRGRREIDRKMTVCAVRACASYRDASFPAGSVIIGLAGRLASEND